MPGQVASGVFKSTDGGGSWSAVNDRPDHPSVYALAIDPQTPATLYAGTWEGGVFKSTDGGESWSAGQHRPDRIPLFSPWRSTRRRQTPSMPGQMAAGCS